MSDNVTLQELFDSQATFSPKDAALLLDFTKLWEVHTPKAHGDEWPVDYYKDLNDIAHKYDCGYEVPTHLGKLSLVEGVGNPTTVH